MDFYNLSGLYQMQASGGLYGLPGSYMPGSGVSGFYSMATLPGSMTSSMLAPTYAKFTNALQKAVGERQTLCEGKDVVMSYPPKYTTDYQADTGKSTREMSPEEYRRYICNKISALPVSASCRLNCSGMLVLKEEAFTNMQKDPAYEKEVLNMLEKGFQAQYPFYSASMGLQVIGGSAGECYGTGLPAVSSASDSAKSQGSGRRSENIAQEREQAYVSMSMGRGGSLADRLASNRAARLQQRENARGNHSL